MGKLQLQGKDLRKIGYPDGPAISEAIKVMHRYYKRMEKVDALNLLNHVFSHAEQYADDGMWANVSTFLTGKPRIKTGEIQLEQKAGDYKVFGLMEIEPQAIHQMHTAMKLPVAVAGALMPDAHFGYGLPVGGVLATANVVIPYAVGVDIGCRMCLSIFDIPVHYLHSHKDKLLKVLDEKTLFGAGEEFKKPVHHEVLDRREFSEIKFLGSLHGKASKQIGSSGSGNHFVDIGVVTLTERFAEFNLEPGSYVALLSHSGSRGLGAGIAQYYTKVAKEKCKLPQVAQHFAWLDMDSEEGLEYWLAMNLAGDYASACHHQIHAKIAKALGAATLARVENHHNFAWKEKLGGWDVIVHRKGATPAAEGVLGIIPGTMADEGYIVRGKGNTSSINSASHGAGRAMSRSQAKNSITGSAMRELLADKGITLIGGDTDEAPSAYKDIREVMRAQDDLVEIAGKFRPCIVKMAGKD